MIIDCDQCVMDGTAACSDCVVTALLGGRSMEQRSPVRLVTAEEHALECLADVGLVAPLRLTPRHAPRRRAGGGG